MSDILIVRDSAVVFKSTGGNVAFNPSGITSGNERHSARYDRGTAATPDRYIWRARTKLASAPAIGAIMTVYLVTSDGTDADDEFPTTGGTGLTVDRYRNAPPIGVVIADEASATRFFIGSGTIEITERYISLGWVNTFGVALSSTDADHQFTLTPVRQQVTA